MRGGWELFVVVPTVADKTSEEDVDSALTEFLERNRDAIASAIEHQLQANLPSGYRVTVELSFWKGSVAFAATIALLLVGKHYAQREALNYLRIMFGTTISRTLRYVIREAAEAGSTAVVTLSLDPSSIASIERFERRALKRLRDFDRRTDALTKHVFY